MSSLYEIRAFAIGRLGAPEDEHPTLVPLHMHGVPETSVLKIIRAQPKPTDDDVREIAQQILASTRRVVDAYNADHAPAQHMKFEYVHILVIPEKHASEHLASDFIGNDEVAVFHANETELHQVK